MFDGVFVGIWRSPGVRAFGGEMSWPNLAEIISLNSAKRSKGNVAKRLHYLSQLQITVCKLPLLASCRH